MIQKICSRCGKPFSGYECKACAAKRAKRYNDLDRDMDRNMVYNNEWVKAKKFVLMRDKGLCRMCLFIHNIMNGDNLTVHHIVPVEDDSTLWYDSNNLITLCAGHHQVVHGRYRANLTEKKRMQSRLRAMFEWE